MAAGKTIEFADNVLQYLVSGLNLPSNTGGLYVALLSALPAGSAPYSGDALASVEVSSGNGYRAALSTNKFGAITTVSEAREVVNADSNNGEVNFSTAPGNFSVSGYALTYSQTSVLPETYVAYELFTGADASKARNVIQGDTIKINVNGLKIREK
jgi:hypothetical protein